MEALLAVVSSLVGASLVGALSSAVASMVDKRQQRALEDERRAIIQEVIRTSPELDHGTGLGSLLDELGSYVSTPTSAQASADDVKREAQNVITSFQERLERMEQRFPEEATVDKIASINDAILGTKVEQLQKSLEQLESRMLTKWDVATIVFTVITAIGGLAVLVFVVANFVLK
jgi:hypothetical protein